MNYREKEYNKLGIEARWLSKEHASNANEYAEKYSSNTRYGLNEKNVTNIQEHIVNSYSIAEQWLKDNFGSTGTVQIVYSDNEVCVIKSQDFLDNWQHIFMPARDDAIILHNLSNKIMFYCHEEELEVGDRDA